MDDVLFDGIVDMQRLILALILALIASPLAATTVVQGYGYCAYDDVVVPGLVVRDTGPAAADLVLWAGLSPFYVLTFEANTDEEVYGSIQMPHGWDGGAITFHVHWAPTVASDGAPAGQKVKWCIDHSWADINTTFPGATTATCATDRLDNTEELVLNRHYITIIGSLSPGASADAGSSVLFFRLYRDANDATNDTYESDAALVSVDAHYRACKAGSVTAAPD